MGSKDSATGALPHRSRGEQAASAIKQLILERRLRPGDPLPTEGELVDALGVSRSSIREAVRTLQSLDIVMTRHGRGMEVGQLSFAPMVESAIFRARLNSTEDLRPLREIVEIRTQLDLSIGDELIERFAGRPQEHLRTLVQQMRERHSACTPFIDLDESFHRALFEATGNQTLTSLMLGFWEVHVRSAPLLDVPPADESRATVDAHAAIVDALETGDADAYRTAVQEHYRPLRNLLAGAADA